MDTESVRALLPPGSRVLCAVSGGSDSMCLLHLLDVHRQAWGIELFAAHYEHGLRGEESLRDAAFVEEYCRSRGIRCVTEHGDVRAFAAQERMGVEEAARRLRYAFLERTADALGCDRIATAHNADDNAETLLMHLARGSGTRGLRGIPAVRGRIVRPLLGVSREEIRRYLEENGVPHVEDSSNGSEAFTRNRVRHRLMPLMRELNPAFGAAAARTAILLEQDEDCLDALARRFLAENFRDGSLPVKELSALHRAIASRVVRIAAGGELSFERAEAVLRFSRGEGPGVLELPGRQIRRDRGRLFFGETEHVSFPDRAIRPGESLDIPELGLRVLAELTVYGREIHSLFKTYFFPCANICGNMIFCTGRRPGDRMHPARRGCGKSLKALFQEAGFGCGERERALVFRDGKGILAVHGLALDERSIPAEGERVIRVTVEKMEDKT